VIYVWNHCLTQETLVDSLMNSNNSMNIQKKFKSFLDAPIGTSRSCLMKKTETKVSSHWPFNVANFHHWTIPVLLSLAEKSEWRHSTGKGCKASPCRVNNYRQSWHCSVKLLGFVDTAKVKLLVILILLSRSTQRCLWVLRTGRQAQPSWSAKSGQWFSCLYRKKMTQHCHVTFSTRERIAQFPGRISKIELTNLVELHCKKNSQEISVTSSALARPQPIRQGNFREIKTSLRE
jgi:hypothetical protein